MALYMARPKIIFVSGGVISGIGKGIATSSIALLLKSRGFNLEETHLTHPERLHLLMGVLALCLLWGLLLGSEMHEKKPIKIKKHGRRAISIFRRGLDQLIHLINNVQDCLKDFRHCCQLLLSCT